MATFRPRRGAYLDTALCAAVATTDLVLIEGDIEGPGPKIEVWRSADGTTPLASERTDIAAVVSDDPCGVSVPVWPRCHVGRVTDSVLALAGEV